MRIFLILICTSTFCYGQIENRWQPDSVYSNRKVKKIFVYMNSPKDLSEIIEFDEAGRKIRATKYSASYNRKTRKSKEIENISLYKYDSLDHLIKIVDSVGTDSTIFHYGTDGKLTSSRKNLGNFVYETTYSYDPFISTTSRKKDSLIVYEKAKEYEYDFYVSRFFGYYLEPKLKTKVEVHGNDTLRFQYSDKEDLLRYEDNKVLKNYFDKSGRLLKSEIKSVFMNDRVNEYQLNYQYYKNGLLKSIKGYVPRYFKYEFWK